MANTVIKAIWQEDHRSPKECADILSDLLAELEQFDPALGGWKLRGRARVESTEVLDTSRGNIEAIFSDLSTGGEDGVDSIKKGVHFGCWSDSPEIGSFDVMMGEMSPNIYNSVKLKFPSTSRYCVADESIERTLSVMDILAKMVDPDFIVWGGAQFLMSQTRSEDYPYFGIVTFLNHTRIGKRSIPDGEIYRSNKSGDFTILCPRVSVREVQASLRVEY